MNIEEFIPIKKNKEEVDQMPPLVWAYIGDCIYELYIRTYLVNNTKLHPHKLHIEAIKYVKAQSQAEFLEKIYNNLTEDEKDIVRRGRNANNHHLPKNSNLKEYTHATALEALVGYLYLTKNFERLKEIIEKYILN